MANKNNGLEGSAEAKKMKTYLVDLHSSYFYSVYTSVEVEASSEEEARENAIAEGKESDDWDGDMKGALGEIDVDGIERIDDEPDDDDGNEGEEAE